MKFNLNEPMKVGFEAENVDPETLNLLTGGVLSSPAPSPRYALTVEHVEQVPARPVRPARVRGFKARLTRVNAKRQGEFELAMANWRLEGSPRYREVQVRRHFPSVQIVEGDR